MFAGIEKWKDDEHDVVIKEIEDILFLGNEVEIQGHQINIEEGDVYKGIKDEGVARKTSQQLKGGCAKLE